jgi:flagellar assembly protein FliH
MGRRIIRGTASDATVPLALASLDPRADHERRASEAERRAAFEREVAALRDAARGAGYRDGHAAGVAHGRLEGAAEIAELRALLGRLRELIDGFDQQVAQDLLGVALEVARQVIRHSVAVRPELLLPVIREAIASLPQAQQQQRLVLHPADAAIVRSVLEANHVAIAPWRIVESADLERGGARIETAASEIDATLEARWRRVIAALGRDDRWLEAEPPPDGEPPLRREPPSPRER